ncbi:clathrin light chain 2-like [Rutidosis leptorrhynchoides]|uniref:clathrin light chain 2-like n=1 Tax=Rutidosis leptorrhynchoides TaxID=125765 RepID=UPI003A9A19B3
MSEIQNEIGFALREWRRQNALSLQEKEKMEKELLNQILDKADEYKINFLNKWKVVCNHNIVINRESEKMFLAGLDNFHAQADKSYWNAIAELIPKEIRVLEARGSKKDADKNTSVVVIQGSKPGIPTDLSRMREIIVKLKNNTPIDLKHNPQPPVVIADASPAVEPVAVA